MATLTTTTKKRALHGWLWFVLLWCGGVAGAVSLGYVFRIFMNLTLFAVK
ncbi:hypothetical protein [Paraburkholderia bannensis]|nr:hypothetical protein [Paraburkholderia bannensis]